jgi:23S rRNA (guanosine2251-2'-O)-methyltransferase
MNKSDYIFGLRAIMEAIDAGKEIDKVLIKKGLQGDLSRELINKIKEAGIVSQWVPMEKLNRITMKNHQGAIALLSPISYYPLENLVAQVYEDGGVPLILILDGLTDTRNFGAIARTAECAGVNAIVIPERGSVSVNADAIKTSAGALMSIPVCRVANLAESVRYLKNCGFRVVGASEKGTDSYTAANYVHPTAIVMGAEDVGISRPVLNECDDLVSIPILGTIGSLNVSVAAGVMIYEAVRQRLNSGMELAD